MMTQQGERWTVPEELMHTQPSNATECARKQELCLGILGRAGEGPGHRGGRQGREERRVGMLARGWREEVPARESTGPATGAQLGPLGRGLPCPRRTLKPSRPHWVAGPSLPALGRQLLCPEGWTSSQQMLTDACPVSPCGRLAPAPARLSANVLMGSQSCQQQRKDQGSRPEEPSPNAPRHGGGGDRPREVCLPLVEATPFSRGGTDSYSAHVRVHVLPSTFTSRSP